MRKIFASILSVLCIIGCTTAPYTGRSQVMFVSEGQETTLGEDAYRHSLRDSVVMCNPDTDRIVRKVGERIAATANKADYKGEFTVINDPETVNAFAVLAVKLRFIRGSSVRREMKLD